MPGLNFRSMMLASIARMLEYFGGFLLVTPAESARIERSGRRRRRRPRDIHY